MSGVTAPKIDFRSLSEISLLRVKREGNADRAGKRVNLLDDRSAGRVASGPDGEPRFSSMLILPETFVPGCKNRLRDVCSRVYTTYELRK